MVPGPVSLREKGVDLNTPSIGTFWMEIVSLREKGVDLNISSWFNKSRARCLPS